MADTELVYLSATEALKRFRDRSLSPVELMEAVIHRAEAQEPVLNALTYRHFDEAMDLARKAEARYAGGGRVRALEGLPVAVKDESAIKGKPTSGGSLLLKDEIATTTSVVNARILRAGGIVHARTATPEFSCAGYTWSRAWGITRNPWNPAMTPGGSSGGSGAALAAGMTPLATGSDIGGSIRVPASFTGTVGYKPPYGRNPEDPPFNLDFYCHNGPMARTVADTILLQNVMSGPSPQDIASLKPKMRLPRDYAPIRGWKIAASVDLGLFEVDAEVRRNTEAALDVFRALGATVEMVDPGFPQAMMGAALDYLEHIFGAYIGQYLAEHGDLMTSYARLFGERGIKSSASRYLQSLEVAGEAYARFGPMLERHDLFVCPTIATTGVPADFDYATGQIAINGKPVSPMLGWALTPPFNMLSRCPVLSVPSGQAANGVPTGIQLVGKTYADRDVMRAGMAYEAALGGWFGADDRPV
ncbi:MAG: amidase [Paracoccaceae bacterium]